MSNEIRLREVPKERMQKVEKFKQLFHVKTIPQVIEKLIDRYQGDQDAIRQLQQRNSQLHAGINKYFHKENEGREVFSRFTRLAKDLEAHGKQFYKAGKAMEKKYLVKKKGGKA